jgi:hypothetical protein
VYAPVIFSSVRVLHICSLSWLLAPCVVQHACLVPLGTELVGIVESVCLLFFMFLLATTNAIHLVIAFQVAQNLLYPVPYQVHECPIGFSRVIFSMSVIETSLSGVHSRSVFGLFNVPAQWVADVFNSHHNFSKCATILVSSSLKLCSC